MRGKEAIAVYLSGICVVIITSWVCYAYGLGQEPGGMMVGLALYTVAIAPTFPGARRFLCRLPRAIRLGIFAWQQQAALEREQKAQRPRIEQEGGGAHWRPGRLVQSIHVEPGYGYTPVGRVDLTKVTPPQRPSPIASQADTFDEKMAELAERIEDAAQMMGVPVKRAFQEAWKLHGIEAPGIPHWIDWNAALEALKERASDDD